jgi:hypothetical protein
MPLPTITASAELPSARPQNVGWARTVTPFIDVNSGRTS